MDRESLFSAREGYKEVDDALKVGELDERGRTRLWSALIKRLEDSEYHTSNVSSGKRETFRSFWCEYLAHRRDAIATKWTDNLQWLRRWYEQASWFEIFDLLEIAAQSLDSGFVRTSKAAKLTTDCNQVFEQENFGYRFVDEQITPITNEDEIDEIEEAISQPLSGVREHLRQAVTLLADRDNPDYRNAIKESISAVESLCMVITGDDGATLGQALNDIESTGDVAVHGALTSAFKSLYGYTSDSDGIRHALLDEDSLDHEDAKYMVVTCSAFVNYLIEKARKAGIDLENGS